MCVPCACGVANTFDTEHLSAPRRGEDSPRVPAPRRRGERSPLAADQLGSSRLQTNRQVSFVAAAAAAAAVAIVVAAAAVVDDNAVMIAL